LGAKPFVWLTRRATAAAVIEAIFIVTFTLQALNTFYERSCAPGWMLDVG
jgi:hypothetical protein